MLWSCGLQPVRLLCPRDSPGKNTGVGCHSLLQGIFPAQESNPGLLHCRQMIYHLSSEGSPRNFGRVKKKNVQFPLREFSILKLIYFTVLIQGYSADDIIIISLAISNIFQNKMIISNHFSALSRAKITERKIKRIWSFLSFLGSSQKSFLTTVRFSTLCQA